MTFLEIDDLAADYLSPHWDRAALLVIDLQRDFLDEGMAPIVGTRQILPRVVRMVRAFRAKARPVVHVVRLYQPGGPDVDLPRRAAVEAGLRLVAPGSEASQIAPGILPDDVHLDHELLLTGALQPVGADEVVLYKPRWSAFHRTGLEGWLREHDVDTVVVVGCNLPNCPRATIFDASERDFRTVLVSDAVSGATPERVADLAAIGVRVLMTLDIDAGQ